MVTTTAAAARDGCIREVWASNLKEEMGRIAELAERYSYISMDTEFPGVVARPVSMIRAKDLQYQTLRCNVDLLKVIQLGITLSDAAGNVPTGVCTWQFNFSFDLGTDMYAWDSIELLRSHGLDFARHVTHGIDVEYFAELLMVSGLVLQDSVVWISFHGMYDFGYLLKVLTAVELPLSEREFFDTLALYFPKFYDLKVLTKNIDAYFGGLNSIADQLKIARIGTSHQAGSDSLLTLNVFFGIMRDNAYRSGIDKALQSKLYGLGKNSVPIHLQPAPIPLAIPATANGKHAQAGASGVGAGTTMEAAQGVAT